MEVLEAKKAGPGVIPLSGIDVSIKGQEMEVSETDQETIYAVVQSIDASRKHWKETADVVSYSGSGAAMHIARECPVGSLVSVLLPLPVELRCFDHDEEQYRIFGLVQYCQKLKRKGSDVFYTGIAFTGSDAPASYVKDPTQSYRIQGIREDGLWNLMEVSSQFKKRRETRIWLPVKAFLAKINEKQASIGGERVVTENISKSGSAVITKLNIQVGERVKLIIEEFDFSGLAVVCNRSDHGGQTKVNLSFVCDEFPVEKLKSKR